MSDSIAEEVRTGDPVVRLIACRLCGVLLWDIGKHYEHAHKSDANSLEGDGDEQ